MKKRLLAVVLCLTVGVGYQCDAAFAQAVRPVEESAGDQQENDDDDWEGDWDDDDGDDDGEIDWEDDEDWEDDDEDEDEDDEDDDDDDDEDDEDDDNDDEDWDDEDDDEEEDEETEEVQIYVIQFNANGGSGEMEEIRLDTESDMELPENEFYRTGYEFLGWSVDPDAESAEFEDEEEFEDEDLEGFEDTVVLYAVWQLKDYRILYVLNGGKNSKKNPGSYTIEDGKIKLTAPSRDGYVFQGWYQDKKYKKKITSIKQGSTGNYTLYAKWKIDRYEIRYQLKGGKNNAKNPSSYNILSSTIKLQRPTRKGYVFQGWYMDKKYKHRITTIKKGQMGDITLYAKWKKA